MKTVNRQTANVGETVNFTVMLTNTCQSPLTNVFFQDTVPNGLSFVSGSVVVNTASNPQANPNIGFALPDVPGGGTATVRFAATVDEIPTPNPALNRANINYSYTPVEGGIPGDFDVTSNEVPVQVGTLADLLVIKTARPSPVQPGETLTYTVTVANEGPSPAINAVLTDNIPAVLSNVEYSTNGGASFSPWSSPLLLGTLAAGASRTILIRGTVSSSAVGEIVNTAVVNSDTPDPNSDNNTDTNRTDIGTGNMADISVSKSAQPAAVVPGELLTYTVVVTNNGPDSAQDVILYDEAPPELSNVQFSVDNGATWNPWINPYPLGSLAAGQSRTILIRGTVRASTCGIISNTAVAASATPDPNPGNNTDTADTPVRVGADLSIRKTACPNPAFPCQCLTYTLTVFNAGPETAEQVVVSDALPAALCKPVYSIDCGRSWHAWNGGLALGDLAAGGTVCIEVAGIVNRCAKGCIQNTATVSSRSSDPNPANNAACVTVFICNC